MKARKNININNSFKADLEAEINPTFGLGGFNFNQKIKDFEHILTAPIFNNNYKALNFELDGNYFYLSLWTKKKEIETEIDLFTGKITSITCRKGYKGKLNNCLLYTSPSPRDQRGSRMPSSA